MAKQNSLEATQRRLETQLSRLSITLSEAARELNSRKKTFADMDTGDLLNVMSKLADTMKKVRSLVSFPGDNEAAVQAALFLQVDPHASRDDKRRALQEILGRALPEEAGPSTPLGASPDGHPARPDPA